MTKRIMISSLLFVACSIISLMAGDIRFGFSFLGLGLVCVLLIMAKNR